ncbi:MAG TPA: TonB-dependent receptor, partial [Bacteroidales bacterium]|nr:TonB-dependent receptor [Bacteroidales bacterium]
MIKKLLFTLSLILLAANILVAQSIVKGVVTDPNGAPQQRVLVRLESEGVAVPGAAIPTNDKGEYQFFGIFAGTYDLVVGGTGMCLATARHSNILVDGSSVVFKNVVFECKTELDEVVVEGKEPIIDQGNPKSGGKVTKEELERVPGRGIGSAIGSFEGVSKDAAGNTNFRGNRSDGQQTIVDGVRMRGGGSIAMGGVEGVELIQGGVPAEFGDGTTFTIITTKGAPKDFHGNAELRGSIDGYNNFLAAFTLLGPLVKNKNPNLPSKAGFMLTAEGWYDKDGSPARGGTWRATDEAIESIKLNPLKYDDLQLGANYSVGEYLTEENFYKQRVRQNAHSYGFVAQGK